MENQNQLTGRHARAFMLLCAMVYFTSYLTRTNYTAVILELTGALGITKSEAGLISTIAFFTYGAGQLFSGFVGDKIYPRRLIAFGLAATSVCNFLMSVSGSVAPMAVIWGVNGLCQAMFWPPLVRLMAENLNDDNYSTACVWVSVGSSFGTIGVYLACPLLIKLGGWRAVFIPPGGLLMPALWLIASGKLLKNHVCENVRTDDDEAPAATGGISAAGFGVLAAVCLAIVLQGILRDGVTTWMPVLVSEQFGLPTGASILHRARSAGLLDDQLQPRRVVTEKASQRDDLLYPAVRGRGGGGAHPAARRVLRGRVGRRHNHQRVSHVGSHRVYARNQPHARVEDSFVLHEIRQDIDHLRRRQRLYICRKRDLELLVRRADREGRVGRHCLELARNRARGRNRLFGDSSRLGKI